MYFPLSLSLCFVQIGQDFEVTFAFTQNQIRVYNDGNNFYETSCKHDMNQIRFVQVYGDVDLSGVAFQFKNY